MQSHRTTTRRVKSISSLPLILTFLTVSLLIAVLPIPCWEVTVVLGTGFWLHNDDEVWVHVHKFTVMMQINVSGSQ